MVKRQGPTRVLVSQDGKKKTYTYVGSRDKTPSYIVRYTDKTFKAKGAGTGSGQGLQDIKQEATLEKRFREAQLKAEAASIKREGQVSFIVDDVGFLQKGGSTYKFNPQNRQWERVTNPVAYIRSLKKEPKIIEKELTAQEKQGLSKLERFEKGEAVEFTAQERISLVNPYIAKKSAERSARDATRVGLEQKTSPSGELTFTPLYSAENARRTTISRGSVVETPLDSDAIVRTEFLTPEISIGPVPDGKLSKAQQRKIKQSEITPLNAELYTPNMSKMKKSQEFGTLLERAFPFSLQKDKAVIKTYGDTPVLSLQKGEPLGYQLNKFFTGQYRKEAIAKENKKIETRLQELKSFSYKEYPSLQRTGKAPTTIYDPISKAGFVNVGTSLGYGSLAGLYALNKAGQTIQEAPFNILKAGYNVFNYEIVPGGLNLTPGSTSIKAAEIYSKLAKETATPGFGTRAVKNIVYNAASDPLAFIGTTAAATAVFNIAGKAISLQQAKGINPTIQSTSNLRITTQTTNTGAIEQVQGFVTVKAGKRTFKVFTEGKNIAKDIINKPGTQATFGKFNLKLTEDKILQVGRFQKDIGQTMYGRTISSGIKTSGLKGGAIETYSAAKYETVITAGQKTTAIRLSPQQYAAKLIAEDKLILSKSSPVMYRKTYLGEFWPSGSYYNKAYIRISSKNTLPREYSSTLAHELIHYNQPNILFKIEDTLKIPYRLQPSEIQAFSMEGFYSKVGFRTKGIVPKQQYTLSGVSASTSRELVTVVSNDMPLRTLGYTAATKKLSPGQTIMDIKGQRLTSVSAGKIVQKVGTTTGQFESYAKIKTLTGEQLLKAKPVAVSSFAKASAAGKAAPISSTSTTTAQGLKLVSKQDTLLRMTTTTDTTQTFNLVIQGAKSLAKTKAKLGIIAQGRNISTAGGLITSAASKYKTKNIGNFKTISIGGLIEEQRGKAAGTFKIRPVVTPASRQRNKPIPFTYQIGGTKGISRERQKQFQRQLQISTPISKQQQITPGFDVSITPPPPPPPTITKIPRAGFSFKSSYEPRKKKKKATSSLFRRAFVFKSTIEGGQFKGAEVRPKVITGLELRRARGSI